VRGKLKAQGQAQQGEPHALDHLGASARTLPGTALHLPQLPWFPFPPDPPDGPGAGASAPAQVAGRSHDSATAPRAEIRLMVLE
jgi:hypothetical protein